MTAFCTQCGAQASDGQRFCTSCGSELHPPATASARSPTTVSAEIVGRNCPYCRFPFEENAQVIECGSCHAVHHADCHSENGGCAMPGCPGGPTGQQPTAILPQAAPSPDRSVTTAWQMAPPPVSPPPFGGSIAAPPRLPPPPPPAPPIVPEPVEPMPIPSAEPVGPTTRPVPITATAEPALDSWAPPHSPPSRRMTSARAAMIVLVLLLAAGGGAAALILSGGGKRRHASARTPAATTGTTVATSATTLTSSTDLPYANAAVLDANDTQWRDIANRV